MKIKNIKTLLAGIVLSVIMVDISSRLCAQKDDLDAVMYKVGMLILQEEYYEAIRLGSPYENRKDITAPNERESMIGILRALSHAYIKTGQRLQAEKTASLLLSYPEADSESDTALSILISVSDTFSALGKYADAQKLLERIRTIAEKRYGASDHRVATAVWDIAELCDKRGDMPGAEKLYLEALAIKMNKSEPVEYDTAILAQRIAEFHQRMKNEERYKYYKALSQKMQDEIDEKSSQE
ncbi:MAG: tetratricopeptide repeat protein [Spirochaetes bacterium]|nr:tetratricopeptide repeat protein [Spirochaetota bacterium]